MRQSKWTQAANKNYFFRITCPICGQTIPEDNGYGSMEIHEYCPEDKNHYFHFMNLFAHSVRIMGKTFDVKETEKIDQWLDKVENARYK